MLDHALNQHAPIVRESSDWVTDLIHEQINQRARVSMPSAEFLRHFGSSHVLCALNPAGGPLRFTAGTIDQVLLWAEGMNAAGFNIYFHPNTVRLGLTNKAKAEDVTQIVSVHDDLDWGWATHAGRYTERMAELEAQQAALHASATPPSLSVFTGGGFQNYYLLKEPLPHTPENRARVEAIVRSFVETRGSDMVGSPDRIMRLPGFLNHANPKKKAAGQPVALAQVVSWR